MIGADPVRHDAEPGDNTEDKTMLILQRKVGESVLIGREIEILVVDLEGGKVRLGITAPLEVSVHREEIFRAIEEDNAE